MDVHGNLIHSDEGIIRLVYLVVITIVIIMGNSMVIIAVAKFKKLRRTTNIMLASLAVADLLVGLLTVPLYTVWTMIPGIFDNSPFLCRVVLLSSLLVVAASQLNLLLLSFERYLAVCAPFKHRSLLICCPWIHIAMVCLTWVISLATTGLASLAVRTDNGVCNYYKAFHKWFLFFAVIFGIFIPFIAIIFVNLKVLFSVRELELQRKYFEDDNSDYLRQVSDSDDQEMRVTLHRLNCPRSDTRRQSRKEFCRSLCFASCKKRNSSQDDVFTDVEEMLTSNMPGSARTNQGDDDVFFPPFCQPDDNIKDKLSGDIFSRHLKFQETPNKRSDQIGGNSRTLTSQGQTENMDQMSDYRASYIFHEASSGKVIQKDQKSFNVDGFSQDKDTGLNCSSHLFVPTEKELCKSMNDFYNCETLMSTSEQMPLLQPTDSGATFSLEGNTRLLPFHWKKHRKIEIFATPKRSCKPLQGDSVDHLNNLIESHSSNAAASMPVIDFEEMTLPSNNVHKGQMLKSGQKEDLKMSWQKSEKRRRQQVNTDSGVEDNDDTFLLPPDKEVIHEAKSLRNLNIISSKNKLLSQSSDIFIHLSKSSKLSGGRRNSVDKWNSGVEENDETYLLPSHSKTIPEAKSLQNLNFVSLQNKLLNQSSDNYVRLAKSSVFHNEQRDSVAVDNSEIYYMPYHYEVQQSNQNLELLPKSSPGNSKKSTITELFTKSDADRSHSDIALSCPLLLDDAHGQAQPISPISGGDYSCTNVCHVNIMTRRTSAPAIFQSATELISDNTSTETHLYSRRQSEPAQKMVKNISKLRNRTYPLPVRPVRQSVGGFSLRKISSSGTRGKSQQCAYISKKVARTVSLVCASFILAWVPFFTVIIMNTFCVQCNLVYFLNAALMVAFGQSACNPIIYALCHTSFRNAYKNIFKQKCIK